VNKAPISWYSKRQNTVESSTFGSEFVAMKTAVEQIQALRLKLRWMGEGTKRFPSYQFCFSGCSDRGRLEFSFCLVNGSIMLS
jgi:hypothetical protein